MKLIAYEEMYLFWQSVYVFGLSSPKTGYIHRQTSNVSRTWVGNEIADQSDVVGASPVGAAPTTSSSLT